MRGCAADRTGAAHLSNRQAKPGVGIRLQRDRHHDCRVWAAAAGGGVRGNGSVEHVRRGELDALESREYEELDPREIIRARYIALVMDLQQVVVDRKTGHGRGIVQAQPVHHLESMFLDGLDASPKIAGNSLAG